jgi:hypothetical protein
VVPTRSPTFRVVTSGATATISPTGSWPKIRGNGPGKCLPERQMYVGVADAARMHLHQYLIRSGFRLRNVFDLPQTADSGNDCSFHNTSS